MELGGTDNDYTALLTLTTRDYGNESVLNIKREYINAYVCFCYM